MMRASEGLEEQSLSLRRTGHSNPPIHLSVFVLFKNSCTYKGQGDKGFADNSGHTDKIQVIKTKYITKRLQKSKL